MAVSPTVCSVVHAWIVNGFGGVRGRAGPFFISDAQTVREESYMSTRMGRLARIGARDEAAKRLNVIESEIKRILDDFPDLRRRQPIRSGNRLGALRPRPKSAGGINLMRVLH